MFLNTALKNFIILIGITISIMFILFVFSNNKSCQNSQKSAILDKYKPICTLAGNYLPYQRWEAAEYSWCVTHEGLVIPGSYKKIANNYDKNYNYYNDIRFNECLALRNNLNISQKLIVILGKIYNPYVS